VNARTSNKNITFAVHPVDPASDILSTWKTYEGIEKLLSSIDHKSSEGILSCSGYNSNCVKEVNYHALIHSVHLAFSQHRPLVLSPDMIWLTIVQGLAQHVRNNPDRLRTKLVSHKGKAEVSIERPDVLLDSPEMDWANIIDELAAVLQQRIGEKFNQLAADFSTSSDLERTVCALAIMDVFEPYFEFVVYSICGIPTVTLEGKSSDWSRLREKTEVLQAYELDWWLQSLRPILEQFERAANGDIDLQHWQNIYKIKEAYGWDKINGWIGRLFPYIESGASGSFTVRNPLLAFDSVLATKDGENENSAISSARDRGITSRDLPSGLSLVPFKLSSDKDKHSMQFIGGFVGVEQDADTRALRPKLGWAVRKLSKFPLMLPEDCSPVPPLEPTMLDDILFEFTSARHYAGINIPGDLISFYKQCDGIEFRAPGAGKFRSFNAVEIIDLPMYKEKPEGSDGHEIEVLPVFWMRIFDLPNECFVAIELERTDKLKFRVSRVDPNASTAELLASSFGDFLNLVMSRGGCL
jgi:hypothetical protein